jgi:acetolactate synthase I/II/III large subunit
MMKLSDYVMRFVAEAGVKHVFMLPGGGAMHLNDSLRRTDGLDFVCNLHEQASAICAEAYCRVTGNLGVALVTTGPGGTNAVTGVACAWLDSTPCLFISGQVKRSDLIKDSGLRQLGVQEIDIVSIVRPITKYAVTVMEPADIRMILEEAIYLARSGRPGPVWIDIPLDVQAAQIDETDLSGFVPPNLPSASDIRREASETLALLRTAERPVLLAGNGIRVAGAIEEFRQLVAKLGIPVLTTCPGLDLLPHSNPLLVGRPGAIASRGANFALQNSDFLLTVGARLDMAMVGYSHRNLARAAKKVVVDIDPAEIEKLDMDIAVKVPADAGNFIQELLRQLDGTVQASRPEWLSRCREWKTSYPLVTHAHRTQTAYVSTYAFTEAMSRLMDEGDTVIVGSSGAAIELVFLCLEVKEGQRIFHNRGTGSMGLGLPQAIGACFANGQQKTILIEGDGSFQLNLQELQTVATHRLPIKMFILNNQGFASIRLSQERHFGGLIGADDSSGLQLPDLKKIAEVYGIKTAQIRNHAEMAEELPCLLEGDGPLLCEIMIAPTESREPSIASRQRKDGGMVSSPLEDLWPFLPRDEFLQNMIIPPLED